MPTSANPDPFSIPTTINGFKYTPAKLSVLANKPKYLPSVIIEDTDKRRRIKHEKDILNDVGLSLYDRSKEIVFLDDERSLVSGGRVGYRSVRADLGIMSSCDAYFEISMISDNEGIGSVRFGIGTMAACIDAPVGSDAFGFGLCLKHGDKVHSANRCTYSHKWLPIGFEDTFGCRIVFKDLVKLQPRTDDPNGLSIFNLPDKRGFIQEKIDKRRLDKCDSDTYVEFYRNGRTLGKAYDIPLAEYYPMVSIYRNAVARIDLNPKIPDQLRRLGTRPYASYVNASVSSDRLLSLVESVLDCLEPKNND